MTWSIRFLGRLFVGAGLYRGFYDVYRGHVAHHPPSLHIRRRPCRHLRPGWRLGGLRDHLGRPQRLRAAMSDMPMRLLDLFCGAELLGLGHHSVGVR